MTLGSRLLCVFYAVVALAAFYGTWSENLAYFGPGAHGGGSFLPDLKVNPASRSFAIAISVTFPLFLLARELRLASGKPVPVVGPVTRALDLAGLAALTVASVGFGLWLH